MPGVTRRRLFPLVPRHEASFVLEDEVQQIVLLPLLEELDQDWRRARMAANLPGEAARKPELRHIDVDDEGGDPIRLGPIATPRLDDGFLVRALIERPLKKLEAREFGIARGIGWA